MIAGFSSGQLIVAASAIDQLYSRASTENKPYTHYVADVFAKAAIWAVQCRQLPEADLIKDQITRNRNRSLGRPGNAFVHELQTI
jgi:hypothetical protein